MDYNNTGQRVRYMDSQHHVEAKRRHTRRQRIRKIVQGAAVTILVTWWLLLGLVITLAVLVGAKYLLRAL